jgi:isopentenyl phosphate kinase
MIENALKEEKIRLKTDINGVVVRDVSKLPKGRQLNIIEHEILLDKLKTMLVKNRSKI